MGIRQKYLPGAPSRPNSGYNLGMLRTKKGQVAKQGRERRGLALFSNCFPKWILARRSPREVTKRKYDGEGIINVLSVLCYHYGGFLAIVEGWLFVHGEKKSWVNQRLRDA